MAMASGIFMAAPGGFEEVYLSTKLDKIDCSQVLAAVLKADRQILGHIKMGAVAHNIEFNWIEDELNAVTFEAMSALSVSITIFGFTGTASLERIVRPGALVAISRLGAANSSLCVDSILRVTSVLDESILVTASYGNTTFTTTSVTCSYHVIAMP